MKKTIFPIIVVAVIAAVYFMMSAEKAQGPVSDTNSTTKQNEEEKVDEKTLSFPGILEDNRIINKKAIIETAKGNIVIELYGDKAPKTVSNFVYLVENAFYDGLTFHRVEPEFVIQGGDPDGDGTGGPGYKFEDEVVQGEYSKGVVAMANSGSNTNGSQFFICLDDLNSLPKKYNLFGKVISGIEVVEQIQVGDIMKSVIIEPIS